MNKFRYAAVSLIGAIPAAILCIFLIGAVTDTPIDNMTTPVKILTFFTMTVGAFVVVLPAGILIFGPKTEKSDETDKESSASEDDEDDFQLGPGTDGEDSEKSESEIPDSEEPAAESGDDLLAEEDTDSEK